MAKYTVELITLLNDDNFKLFDFNYKFYNESNKEEFETKFIDTYLFHEIGFETVVRFKQRLKTKLNNIYPYYKQLYETELRCLEGDIDFMLNKDLRETFTREITGNIETNNQASLNSNSSSSSSSEGENNNTLTSSTTGESSTSTKASNLDNGNASLELSSGNITSMGEGEENNNTSSSETSENLTSQTMATEGSETSTSSSDTNQTNNQTENTELVSKGNIGVTSSAELLQKWREVLINIDWMIIEECSDLFMQVY